MSDAATYWVLTVVQRLVAGVSGEIHSASRPSVEPVGDHRAWGLLASQRASVRDA